jgi:recombination protein RecR
MLSKSIQKLIDLFSKFPTVGPRTASRFVFYLIKLPQENFDDLMQSILDLRKNIKTCSFCFDHFENSNDDPLCSICSNAARNRKLLCIIEKESDLIAIENTSKFKGLYFILNGNVSTLKKEHIDKLRIEELERRIISPSNFILNAPGFDEIIIATNPTPEGESTALFLERRFKEITMPDNKTFPKISRLARGLPMGGELEYADDETLGSAFEGRR